MSVISDIEERFRKELAGFPGELDSTYTRFVEGLIALYVESYGSDVCIDRLRDLALEMRRILAQAAYKSSRINR